jgi:DNA polymerase-1
MSQELGERLAELEQAICDHVGYRFNVNSTQQLSDALFKVLGLPTEGLPKTDSGHYSTAAGVLEMLKGKHEVVRLVLEQRELSKLKSTYLDALPQLVNPQTGRVHTSFNQTGTVTGRISSSDPNLQNIPIRTEQGRRVRDAFIAAPGNALVGADYSQIELRVLAHISGDPGLLQAFHEGQDIHASTAAVVYGIPIEQVTLEQRNFAKRVNFGLLYGMSAFRLARESDLTLSEAEEFVTAYFERFPRVRGYFEETKRRAAENGYVETLLKRRRYFSVLQSRDTSRATQLSRRAAEREAINMPIQGTAADIIKIAMIRLQAALGEHGLRGQMTLQVHDELVLEAPKDEAEETARLVSEVMENAYPLDAPLRADTRIGHNWGELK